MNDLIWENENTDRGMTPMEIRTLLSFIRARDPKRILEIGTHRGRTLLNIHKAAPEAQITSVDIVDAKVSNFTYPAAIRFIIKDSKELNFRELGGFDFIFIDGDHTSSGVRNDTRGSLDIINPQGIIFWHDYDKIGPFIEMFGLNEHKVNVPSINLAYYERTV